MISVILPLPPTSNHRLVASRGGRLIKSEQYRRWQDEAALIASSQALKTGPLTGSIAVMVRAVFNDRRTRDLDNVLKPVNDVLVKGHVIKDDGLIDMQLICRQAPPLTKTASRTRQVKAANHVILYIWERGTEPDEAALVDKFMRGELTPFSQTKETCNGA